MSKIFNTETPLDAIINRRSTAPAVETETETKTESETREIAPVKNISFSMTGIEKKSKRLHIAVKPSTYERVRQAAQASGTSVNDWINYVLDNVSRQAVDG